MFETAVAQAQQVATPVRAVERVHAEEVGEPREPAQVAREEQVSAAPATRGYRFTLRGQRVLVALGFAAAIAAGAIAGTLIGPPELPEETATMVVQSGDSLWSIASSIAEPGEDLGPVMSEIRQLNGLETAHIASGQELVVPSN
ncbi:MAG TPA: LysM peptidoglycan-binding domain-containing protein [Beutenbergiaceae bacterium]|nr:LysM peptidoglycan-binding domain-containing protein [Beutenbergiaceae bacterium]